MIQKMESGFSSSKSSPQRLQPAASWEISPEEFERQKTVAASGPVRCLSARAKPQLSVPLAHSGLKSHPIRGGRSMPTALTTPAPFRETIPIVDIYVPMKRRATLEQKRVDEIAVSILEKDLQAPTRRHHRCAVA
jgi:hypothetical protein